MVRSIVCAAIVWLIQQWSSAVVMAQAPLLPSEPCAADEHTLVLAHFDKFCHADFAVSEREASGSARIVAEGRFGKAMQLVEGDEWVFPGGENYPGETGTVEFWLRPAWNGNDGKMQPVLSAGHDAWNYLNINKLASGRFGAAMSSGTSQKDRIYHRVEFDVSAWKAGQWHHVAVCWSKGELGLWLDGRLAAKTAGATAPKGPVLKIVLSGNGITIDEFQISRVVRYTADGIAKGKAVTGSSKLHPNWHFVEPPGAYRAAQIPAPVTAGMAIVTKNYLDEFDPRSLTARSRPPAVSLFAAPGQTEAASLIVVARDALQDLKIQISDLKSSANQIAARCATVRRVIRTPMRRLYTSPPDQTEIVSRFLPRWQPMKIPAKEFREVWLSLDVPGDAQPGRYSGEIVLTHSAGTRRVPLTLDVLHIRLMDHPKKQLGSYYYMSNRLLDPDRLMRELADMRDHGVRHLNVWIGIRYLTHDKAIAVDTRALREALQLIQRAGFTAATIVVQTGLEELAVLLGHRGKDGHMDPAGVAKDARFHQLAKEAVESALKLAGEFPDLKLVFTHLDEIFDHPGIPQYLELSKAVRQVPQARLYITFNTAKDEADQWRRQIDPWVDLRGNHGYTFEWWLSRGHTMDEYERELRASGDEAWFYHNARGVHFTPKWARIINGMYLWASPFRVHCPWTYQSYRDNPFDDTDGGNAAVRVGHDFGMSMPGIDDPADLVPTRVWEAMRAGADDLRYFAALERAIDGVRGSKPKQAADAQAFLNRVRNLIRKARPAAGATRAPSGKGRSLVDLDTVLQTGQGVSGSAKEAPLINALSERFSGDGLQQLRRQAADWIVRLEGSK